MGYWRIRFLIYYGLRFEQDSRCSQLTPFVLEFDSLMGLDCTWKKDGSWICSIPKGEKIGKPPAHMIQTLSLVAFTFTALSERQYVHLCWRQETVQVEEVERCDEVIEFRWSFLRVGSRTQIPTWHWLRHQELWSETSALIKLHSELCKKEYLWYISVYVKHLWRDELLYVWLRNWGWLHS